MAIGDKVQSNYGLITGSVRMCKCCGRDYDPAAHAGNIVDYTCPHCGTDNYHKGLRGSMTIKGKHKLKNTQGE